MKLILKEAKAIRATDQKKGFEAYYKALAKARQLQDTVAIIEAYRRCIFIAGAVLHKTDSALAIAEEAIAFGHSYNDVNTLCEMYGLKGVAFQAVGMLDSAVVANVKALQYMEQDKAADSLKNWPLYLNVADLYSKLGNQQLAVEMTRKYLDDYVLRIKDTARMITSYNNLSVYHTLNGNKKEAAYNIRKAWMLQKLKSSTEDGLTLLLGMAAMYNNIEQYDSSLIFSNKAYQKATAENNEIYLSKVIVIQMETAVATKNKALCEKLVQQPMTLNLVAAKDLPLKEQKELHQNMYQIYEILDNEKQAYHHLKLANELAASVRVQEQNKDLEHYEIERKKAMQEQALLAKQLQLKKKDNLILLLALLALAGISTGGWLLMRSRRNRILQENRIELLVKEQGWEKEKSLLQGQLEERNRISRELHDDLGTTLTAIALKGEILKRKTPLVNEEIDGIVTDANGMVDTLNEIVWSLNSRNDSLYGLVAYIRKFASTYFQNFGIKMQATDHLPEEDLIVLSSIRRAMYLTAKEAFSNITKHSAAQNVSLIFQFQDHQLSIQIKDDGKGLQSESNSKGGGNGLPNMKKNMELVNGSVTITEQNGVAIEIICKIAATKI